MKDKKTKDKKSKPTSKKSDEKPDIRRPKKYEVLRRHSSGNEPY